MQPLLEDEPSTAEDEHVQLDNSESELEHDTIAMMRETPPTPPALPIQAVESSLELDASVTDENQVLQLDPELLGTIGNHITSNNTFVLDAAPT